MYHSQRYNTSLDNPCRNNECSHLCLLVPGGHRCSCPDTQMHSHRSKAEIICDAAAERPRPAPRVCPCQNGGICRESDTNSELYCECPPDYLGQYCDVHVAKSHQGASGTTAIVVPIVVVMFVLAAATGVWVYLRKRPFGKGVGLGGIAGNQAVSFRQGTNVEFGNNTFNGNGAEALDVAYNLDNMGNKSRDFSNPMYDVQNNPNIDPNLGNGSSGKTNT